MTIEDPFFTINGRQYQVTEVSTPPQPVNCVWGPWSAWLPISDWSACVNGTQSRAEQRTRTIEIPPSNGGVPCEGPTAETRTVSQACTVIPPDPGGLLEAHGNNFNNDYWLPADHLDPAKLPTEAQAIPWTTFVNANGALANHAGGKLRRFRSLPVYGNTTFYGNTVPAVFRDGNKRLVQNQLNSNFGAVALEARDALKNWQRHHGNASPGPFPFREGPRGFNILSPYLTVYGHTRVKEDGTISTDPNTPLFLSLQLDGLLQGLMRDGSVRNLMQLPIPDDSYTNDMALWDESRKVFFYLNSVHGVVMRVDRGQNPPVISEFADGFGLITSCKVLGKKLYVVERSTGKIWELNTDNPLERRVVATIFLAFWIEYDSKGNLIVMTEDQGFHRINPTTNVVTLIQNGSGTQRLWVQCSVDRTGSCGPKDTIYYVAFTGNSNTNMVRIFPDGTTSNSIGHGQGSMSTGDVKWVTESGGHYRWTSAVHPDEGLIAEGGAWSPILSITAIIHEADPQPAPYPYPGIYEYDAGLGLKMLLWGGTQAQYKTVPSFTCQVGVCGASANGLTFDYLTSLGYQGLKDWFLSGGAGSVPRTLTDAQVYYPMSYVMINSQQHLQQGRALIDGLRTFLGIT